MITVQWIVAFVCFALALWLSVLNWRVFWKRHVQKVQASSWLPLIGGGLGAVGIVVLPVAGSVAWCWIPLVLDWGSIPGIGYSLFFHLTHRKS
jgi:hypothetical protein